MGRYGEIYGEIWEVLRTMNSLRMSFWMVPLSCACCTPCSSAATTYIASTGSTAPFIVIETETLVRVRVRVRVRARVSILISL